MAFVDGATAFGCCLIALAFWRFWRETRDRLFAMFAVAFLIFAGNRVVLSILGENEEGQTVVYLVRFLAFALIALAIIDKNRAAPAPDRALRTPGGTTSSSRERSRSGHAGAER